MRLFLVLCAASAVAGCRYSPDIANGKIACVVTAPKCPDGFQCVDQLCWKDGQVLRDAAVDSSPDGSGSGGAGGAGGLSGSGGKTGSGGSGSGGVSGSGGKTGSGGSGSGGVSGSGGSPCVPGCTSPRLCTGTATGGYECLLPCTSDSDCPGDPKNTATLSCQTGACRILSCSTALLADCDNLVGNGCEIDKSRNAEHCGSCGAPCPTGVSCEAGVCASPAPAAQANAKP